MSDRPLSDRLAEIADLPSIGIALTLERRTALAEAVELARRVEAARTAVVFEDRAKSGRLGRLSSFVSEDLIGKRVALVEVRNG